MTAHHLPSPDRIIEAHRAPEDRTLADMQAALRTCWMHAERADRNGDLAAAVIWRRRADDEEHAIALHISRVAHGAAAAQDVPAPAFSQRDGGPGVMGYLVGAVLILAAILLGIPAVCMAWVWAGGLLT